jgi:hypothetical protein
MKGMREPDRNVFDVIRDLSIVIGTDRKLCLEAAQLLAVTNTGLERIEAANDKLQAVIQAQTAALTAADRLAKVVQYALVYIDRPVDANLTTRLSGNSELRAALAEWLKVRGAS